MTARFMPHLAGAVYRETVTPARERARRAVSGRWCCGARAGTRPDAVATFPIAAPILAVGGDLKNAVTLVAGGQAYVSQHVGDLSHLDARRAFDETIADLLAMYAIDRRALTAVHDAHPEYASTLRALEVPA